MGSAWAAAINGAWVQVDAFDYASAQQNGGDPWYVTLQKSGVASSTVFLKGEFDTKADALVAAGRIVGGYDPSATDGGS